MSHPLKQMRDDLTEYYEGADPARIAELRTLMASPLMRYDMLSYLDMAAGVSEDSDRAVVGSVALDTARGIRDMLLIAESPLDAVRRADDRPDMRRVFRQTGE